MLLQRALRQVIQLARARVALDLTLPGGPVVFEEPLAKPKDFTLAGVAERIECPTLICHGERDRLATMDTARQLYDAVGAKDKTLKIFTPEDGGVEHCQVDNRQVGTDYICDWLGAKLG